MSPELPAPKKGALHGTCSSFVFGTDEGPYQGGAFLFAFSIPESYPHDPPRVQCFTKASLDDCLGHSWHQTL